MRPEPIRGAGIMGQAVEITRQDHSAADLRKLAGKCDDAAVVRRLLAIAAVLDGSSRTEAARHNGMDRQTLRDWVHRYNGEGIAGLTSRQSPGRAPALNKAQMQELKTWSSTDLICRRTRWCAGDAAISAPKWIAASRSKCMSARSESGCAP
jgi:transposase